jgi:hypothetical protein
MRAHFHGGIGRGFEHRKTRAQIKPWFSTRAGKAGKGEADLDWSNPNAGGLLPESILQWTGNRTSLSALKAQWRGELPTGAAKARAQAAALRLAGDQVRQDALDADAKETAGNKAAKKAGNKAAKEATKKAKQAAKEAKKLEQGRLENDNYDNSKLYHVPVVRAVTGVSGVGAPVQLALLKKGFGRFEQRKQRALEHCRHLERQRTMNCMANPQRGAKTKRNDSKKRKEPAQGSRGRQAKAKKQMVLAAVETDSEGTSHRGRAGRRRTTHNYAAMQKR